LIKERIIIFNWIGKKYHSMSLESAKQFMTKIKSDQSFADSLKETKPLDRKQFIMNAGFDFTDAELKEVREEVSDEELADVAGGAWHPSCSKDGHCGKACENHTPCADIIS